MIRRAMFLGVLLVPGLHASVFGDVINVPDDQPSIQAAIDVAADGDRIIVAPGTYFENINFLGKAITLRSSAGPEVTTIDAGGEGTVVTCENEEGPDTVIDGFAITGGSGSVGGGMMIDSSSPTVTRCAFSGNTAGESGGAMAIQWFSDPMVTNCAFSGNDAGELGGAMVVLWVSDPAVTDCTFSDNTAEVGGGVAVAYDSHPILTDCIFSDNAAVAGGGINMGSFGGNMVIHCTFSGNTALTGGGLRNGSSQSLVTHCTFIGNAAESGGGMFNLGAMPVTNCMFSGNAAESGGGMFNHATNPSVTNCTFGGNSAVKGGGAIHNGGIYNRGGPTITNCILWNNGPNPIMDTGAAESTVYYSDVEGGWAGEGNIDLDPLFVDAGFWDDNGTPRMPDDDFWVEGDYHLLPGSPCIDAADNTAVPEDFVTDLDGNLRFVDDPNTDDTGLGDPPIVDMGAYEFQFQDSCADDDGDGRVTICHIPPGNPGNAHTISVGARAVPAHLAHGDSCGPCEEDDSLLLRAGESEVCSADVNGDGAVGPFDLAILLGAWGPCEGCPTDFNADGVVNAADLAQVLGGWGMCP